MMFRRFAFVALALSMMGGQVALARGLAHPCHDAKGKFTKCEKPQKPAPCHDKKGKFTKCEKPQKPVPCRDKKGKFTKCDKKYEDQTMRLKSDMPAHSEAPSAQVPADSNAH